MNLETGNNGYLTNEKTKFQLAGAGVQHVVTLPLQEIHIQDKKKIWNE